MTKTMKAAVVREFGKPLTIEEVAVPEPGPGEIQVAIRASGVCHTDLHAAEGDWPVKPTPPFIPGHEGVGFVSGVGKGVLHVREGDRVGVPTIRSDKDGADPASVAFTGVRAATDLEADVLIIDTAGRLQTKTGLMDELGKLKRVTERALGTDGSPGSVDEVLLVLDATTGQNGLRQAQVFSEVVAVTGIVLTKLDGTAKGGIVVAVQRQLGVPVKLVGLGEGLDDLAPFEPGAFVDALLG